MLIESVRADLNKQEGWETTVQPSKYFWDFRSAICSKDADHRLFILTKFHIRVGGSPDATFVVLSC
jgi:hypothetical protein